MKTTPVYGWPYPEPGDHTRTWEYWQNLATAIESTVKSLQDIARGKELWTNKLQFTFSAAATSANASVTFPVGRFTAAPSAGGTQVPTGSGGWMVPRITIISASSATLQAWCTSSQTGTFDMAMVWANSPTSAPTARQTAAPELPPGYREATATCHTPECGNADTPITVYIDDNTTVTCGGCGQPITDIA